MYLCNELTKMCPGAPGDGELLPGSEEAHSWQDPPAAPVAPGGVWEPKGLDPEMAEKLKKMQKETAARKAAQEAQAAQEGGEAAVADQEAAATADAAEHGAWAGAAAGTKDEL